MQGRSSSAVKVFYPKYDKKEVIERLRLGLRTLAGSLPLKHAVLFGSYAKGNYTVASDIDILIVYEGKRREDAYALCKQLLEIRNLEPHVYCNEEYEVVKQTIQEMVKNGLKVFP